MIIAVKRPSGDLVEAVNVPDKKEFHLELNILMDKYKGKGYIFEYTIETEDNN